MNLSDTCETRFYDSPANERLLKLVEGRKPGRALDCGCGAGGNARVLSSLGWQVDGVTLSPAEQSSAQRFCRKVLVANLEQGLPDELTGKYDLIVMSHVLEHLIGSSKLLKLAAKILAPDAVLAVALPNVLQYRMRLEFLFGNFTYASEGILDSTHVRFYTFQTGRELLEGNGYRVIEAKGDGGVPQRGLRRILPRSFTERVDRFGCESLPGLFSWQLLYLAQVDNSQLPTPGSSSNIG
jgi:SAM-dependent methyltransferase